MRNLITFSIVFTNKNGMDRFNPPSNIRVKNTTYTVGLKQYSTPNALRYEDEEELSMGTK